VGGFRGGWGDPRLTTHRETLPYRADGVMYGNTDVENHPHAGGRPRGGGG